MKNKFKKLLSLLLCSAMLISLVSVKAMAEGEEDILITEADATVPKPIVGYNPRYGNLDVPQGAHYTASVYSWWTFEGDGTVTVEPTDVIKVDKTYFVRVLFTAESGYKFSSSDTVFKINGEEISGRVGGDGVTTEIKQTYFSQQHVYDSEWKSNNRYHWKECQCGQKGDKDLHTFKDGVCTVCGHDELEEIPELDLTAFKLPVAGDSVTDEAYKTVALPDDAKYNVTGIEWYICDRGEPSKPVEDKFEEGHTYRAIINFELNSTDYMFAARDKITAKYSVPDKNFYGCYVNENGDDASVYFKFTLVPSDAKFITELTVTGVTPPVAGETPTVEGISLGENVEIDTYCLSWLVWDEEEGYFSGEFFEVFEEGKKYALQIVAYPMDGYYFADNLTVSINGKNIPDADYNKPDIEKESLKEVIETELYMQIIGEDMVVSSDTETDTSTNTETETDTSTNTETETDTSTNTESETDTSTDTNTDTSTESDTDIKTIVSGDINCDGKINMEDVTSLQKVIAKLIDFEKYGETSKANADCNNDGKENMEDVVQIQKFIAKLIPSL